MTAPREVVPGKIYLCSRRCSQRQFRLRPDPHTNRAFEFCLAYAASMTGVLIIAFFASSNHHHLVLQDVQGRLPDFFKIFHTLLAKHQNALHGRFEAMWSPDKTSAVWCADFDDLVDKVVYLLTNPVKDNLVKKAAHWPGAISLAETLEGHAKTVCRPRVFFDPNGGLPDQVTLQCGLPSDIDRQLFLQRVRDGIEDIERQTARWRKESGNKEIGVAAILSQKPTDSPASREKRFRMNPQIAAKAKGSRIEAILHLKAFRAAYTACRQAWLLGQTVIFPFGTWWLRKHAGVLCHPCPA